MAYKDKKKVNTHEIWGGDPGANAGRDTKADEITLGLCERSFMLFVSPLLSILASCNVGRGVREILESAVGPRTLCMGMDLPPHLLSICLSSSFPGHSALQPTGNAL